MTHLPEQPELQKPAQVVFTNKARCRDCYRCVRVCPVKAIRMQDGQAYVDEDRCIACGTCIRECPQEAKSYRNDIEKATRLARGEALVAASLAPSFAAVFTDWERYRLPSALRRLGCGHVAETSIGAYLVARRTAEYVAEHPAEPHIATACPSVVNYVERYYPDLVHSLLPVVSPMIAHARYLRETLGEEIRVLFIGPCVAKKQEADRPEHDGLVDCVLTFSELREWMDREGIELNRLEESGFDDEPGGDARYFPLVGGSLRTAHMETDVLAAEVISVSGEEEVRQALESLRDAPRPIIIEPLFCLQGCINGPSMGAESNIFERRRELLSYAQEHIGRDEKEITLPAGLETFFEPHPVKDDAPVSDDEIRRVLELTGKFTPEDELNCGACGYNSCRDKAAAVVRGFAEPEMCMPYMRRMAEKRTDRIIETSPNGIVILDEDLHIIHMNPAFRTMFMCTEAVAGKHISYLMDPEPFERLVAGQNEVVDMTVRHDRYNLVTHQLLYPLREERQFVGIFVNVTGAQQSQKELDRLHTQTLAQAKDLLEHQIQMAQHMARLLGESTAQGEQLVDQLMQLGGGVPDDAAGEDKDNWLKDTYTSR